MPHDAFGQCPAADVAAGEKGRCEQPIDDGGLPLNEDRVPEKQGDTAEKEHEASGGEQHLVDRSGPEPLVAYLQGHGDDERRRGGIDVGGLVDHEEYDDGQKVDQSLHDDAAVSERCILTQVRRRMPS